MTTKDDVVTAHHDIQASLSGVGLLGLRGLGATVDIASTLALAVVVSDALFLRRTLVKPMMAPSGVRSSWLMLARKPLGDGGESRRREEEDPPDGEGDLGAEVETKRGERKGEPHGSSIGRRRRADETRRSIRSP